MKSTTVSPILDTSTAMTENDVLRLLKGFIARNNYGNAIYCLDVLERSKNYFDRVRQMVIVLFFQLGVANDFADLSEPLLAATDFPRLRDFVVKMCCRENNGTAFMPDLLARVTGYNQETTLLPQEQIAHLQYPVLMEKISTLMSGQPPFAHQCFVAAIFNMLNQNKDLGYLPVWYSLRCARLGMALCTGRGDLLFWGVLVLLPVFYKKWAHLAPFLDTSKQLYMEVHKDVPFCWDKRRAIFAAVVAGVIFGIQANIELATPEDRFSSRPELFPDWFYATKEAPPMSAKILFRLERPEAPEVYLKKKYPRLDVLWSDLQKEALNLMKKEVIEKEEVTMRYQAVLFSKHLSTVHFSLPPQSPATRPHCFITDGAVRSSRKNPANHSFLNLSYIDRDQAAVMPSSLLVHNGAFVKRYGKLLAAKSSELTIMAAGPFCQSELVVKMLVQLALMGQIGAFPRSTLEPYVHLQRDGVVLVVMIENECRPIEEPIDDPRGKMVWTMGWIIRYLLTLGTQWEAGDLVSFLGTPLWLHGLYPDDRAFVEEECIANLMKYGDPETYTECMEVLQGAVEEQPFRDALWKLIPKTADFTLQTMRGMAVGYRTIVAQRYAQLGVDLPVQSGEERKAKRVKVNE